MPQILVVDDEEGIRVTLREFLREAGHQVETAETASEALGLLKSSAFDVVVSDVILAGTSGLDLLKFIHDTAPNVQVIMMTGEPSVESASAAVRSGAVDYMFKPVTKNAVLRAVGHAAEIKVLGDEKRRLEESNHRYQENLEQLVEQRTRDLNESNRSLQAAVAKLKETQQQVIQQERLNALGQMVSGIAHDFNNVLMPILGLSDFMLANPGMLDDRKETLECLENIRSAAADAREIVRRLREFYRPNARLEAVPVDLAALVRDVLQLTEASWKTQAQAEGKRVALKVEMPDDLPPVTVNEARLREVATNLVINAVDAMPQGGQITVSASATDTWMVLEFRDTGVGMPEEVRRRCLEPFFSTKGEHGTGLGLAMCHGIVQRHGGLLDIESREGKGTTIRIRLPLEREDGPGEPVAIEAASEDHVVEELSILVVDDEETSLALLKRYLSRDGHTVRTATSGEEAIELLQSGAWDLVLTDRAMPGVGGDQVALAAGKQTPRVPAIMLTGFGELMTCSQEAPEGVSRLLAKPVTQQELCDAVAAVVRAGGTGTDREPDALIALTSG